MKKLSLLILGLLIIVNFTFAQNITVISPNGGENWNLGSTHNITWNASDLTNDVKITLWKGGALVGLIVKDITPSSGSYPWTAGNYVGGTATGDSDYKIKIREQGGALFTTEDISNGAFTISESVPVAPTITVTSPTGGKNLIYGVSFEIKWNSTNVNHNIGILLMKGSVFEGTVYAGPNTGSYNWKFDKFLDNSPVEAGIYKIRVRSIDDYSVYNDSGEFTIKKLSFPHSKNLKILRKFYRPVFQVISKVDLTVTGIAKTNSSGGRYITYTVKNLNYNIVELSTPVWFKVWDTNNSSNKKQFGLFQWQSALDNFNSSGEYTSNVPIQEGWSPNIKIKIDPFGHISESNENNNEAEVNF